jgi:hypothetical protein
MIGLLKVLKMKFIGYSEIVCRFLDRRFVAAPKTAHKIYAFCSSALANIE